MARAGLLKNDLLLNEAGRGRIVPFLPIAFEASRNDIFCGVRTTLRNWDYVVLCQLSLFTAVSTAVVIGFLDLFPLLSGQGIRDAAFLGASILFGVPGSVLVLLSVLYSFVIFLGLNTAPFLFFRRAALSLFPRLFEFFFRRQSSPSSPRNFSPDRPVMFQIIGDPPLHILENLLFVVLVVPLVITAQAHSLMGIVGRFSTLRTHNGFHRPIVVHRLENGKS